MVTKDQAMAANEFHYESGAPKTGGKKCYHWRRNGKTKTWKTRPDEFRVPIKYGLYDYGYITHLNAWQFHVASECPMEGDSK